MTFTGLQNFDTTLRRTNSWLKDVRREQGAKDRHEAYRALRATLKALRDMLTTEQSAKLVAQLPLLLRGVYFEGWTPGKERRRVRHAYEFLNPGHGFSTVSGDCQFNGEDKKQGGKEHGRKYDFQGEFVKRQR